MVVLGNAGRTEGFNLRSLGQLGQQVQIGLFGRGVTQTRMRPARVVPVKIFGNVGAGGADAVVGLQVIATFFEVPPDTWAKFLALARGTDDSL